MNRIRNNIRSIILKDEKVLTIKIVDGADEYYILPGGELEFGETAAEALKRECEEEIGCDVAVKECVFVREYLGPRRPVSTGTVGDKQFLELYFLAELITEPDLMVREKHQKEIKWLRLDELGKAGLKPEFLARVLRNPIAPEKGAKYLGDVD